MSLTLRTHNINPDSRFFQQLIAAPPPPSPLILDPGQSRSLSLPSICRGPFSDVQDRVGCEELVEEETEVLQDRISSTPSPLSQKTASSPTFSPLYSPSERWKWILDSPIVDVDEAFLSDGAVCSAFLNTAQVGEKQFKYISKRWPVLIDWKGRFYSELALYKKHMKDLQGDVVSSIITVLDGPATLNVAMEPPHHSFWIEASSDMPLVLKDRCVEAFEKLHARGVLHGDVELRHMLIGGDGKVTIIDFQQSRALEPIPDVRLERATPAELRREMRKVKVKLDYPGARDLEYRKFQRHQHPRQANTGSPFSVSQMKEDALNPPIRHQREWEEWVEERPLPKRFVMPGQDPSIFLEALRTFLDDVDPRGTGFSTTRQLSTSHHVSLPMSEAISDSGVSLPEIGPRTRKRSLEEGESYGAPSPQKKPRTDDLTVARTPEIASIATTRTLKRTYSDVFSFESLPSSSHPPPSSKRARSRDNAKQFNTTASSHTTPETPRSVGIADFLELPQTQCPRNLYVPQTKRRSPSTDAVAMQNLAACALEQLPHPTLVELFPTHPRWQETDVRAFLAARDRKLEQTIRNAIHFPDRTFCLPREMRSRGNLKREIHGIRQRLGYPPTSPSVLPDTGARTDSLPSLSGKVRFSVDDQGCAWESPGLARTAGESDKGPDNASVHPAPGTEGLQHHLSLYRPFLSWVGSVFDWW
ncbi:hypothetical protein PQX77_013308 [Marasmius sp. AFHP31]|nr:hypothetical protein PQX77_013308 [Marasmius sp. AFHP31]